jgi:hypothetical protein
MPPLSFFDMANKKARVTPGFFIGHETPAGLDRGKGAD